MKKKVGLAVLLVVVLVLSSLFAFGAVFAKQPADAGGGKPLTVLLDGGGWYYGIPPGCVNNAEAVAMALDGEMVKARDASGTVIAKGKVHGTAFPVIWADAVPALEAAIEEFDPDIVFAMGTSGGAKGIRPEPVGSNVMRGCDALAPDDPDRVCYDKEPIEVGGPDYRYGNLPYEAMVMAMLEAGISARLGQETGYSGDTPPLPMATPGWYLCNYMTYNLAMMTEEGEYDFLAGFFHIPQRSEYAALFRLLDLQELEPGSPEWNELLREELRPSLELERTIDGIRICIEECLRAKAGF